MKKEILILLPEKISVLRDVKNQGIRTDIEEYSIYYKNIIYPYSDEYDIQIECRYGKNLGHCWRIDTFSNDMGIFNFALKIYGHFGELLAEKSCRIEIFEKKSSDVINLLCIGDSMTQSEIYISHAVNKLQNINTVGTRSISHLIRHEGRGGWTCAAYFERYEDNGWGVSPFLFPKDCSGNEYFGSKRFWDKIGNPEYNTSYSYAGTQPQSIKNGMLCYDGGELCRYADGQYIGGVVNQEFEFSFKKYLERYGIETPDIISILFGANEFQTCKYKNLAEELNTFINSINKMIESIKQCGEDIKIIVNMPICGGGQYAWGNQLGCIGSSKQYDYCIKMAGKAILKEFDCRRDENIFVCPMLAVCDSFSGFPWEISKANIYSDRTETNITNWVHPSEVGYKQMGDALAGVIADIRG